MRPLALFISEQTLKDRAVLNENIDPKALRQTILIVQEEKLLPALGTGLYNRLITGISASSLTANEQTLMNDYVTPVMTWYVMGELPMALGPKYYNRGMVKKTPQEGAEAMSMSEMRDLMDYYNNKAEFQKKRLTNYLKQNASATLFPEYINPGTDIDTIFPEADSYTCPIVLDRSEPKRTNGYDYDRHDISY